MAWARTHRLLATLIPVLVIVAAVGAAIVSSGGGQNGNAAGGATDNSVNSSGTVSGGTVSGGAGTSGAAGGKGGARTTGVGHQVHAPEQPAVTKGEKWITGPAGKLLTAVNTEVGKISADQRAGDDNAAKNLGPLLSADAKAALDGPMPPVRAEVYRVALEDFEQIGQDTTSGNFSRTGSLLTTANVDIMSVTTAANQAAPVNSAAQVNDPSDG